MIHDILAKVNLHLSRASQARDEINEFKKDLDTSSFQEFEKVKTIDTFIYRFIKLQDMMGDKLFRIFLDKIGEYKDSMSLLDILDKLEKLNIIDDANKWMEYRNLRNKLTHEYPSNEDEVVQGIFLALDVFVDIEKIFNDINSYTQEKQLS